MQLGLTQEERRKRDDEEDLARQIEADHMQIVADRGSKRGKRKRKRRAIAIGHDP